MSSKEKISGATDGIDLFNEGNERDTVPNPNQIKQFIHISKAKGIRRVFLVIENLLNV